MSVLQAILLLIGITCKISYVISQKIENSDNVPLSDHFQNKRISEAMEKYSTDALIRPRRYRRPHIERVWIMRSFGADKNVTEKRSNFTDPIRSFAIAIRDPETFLRYLRQEEKRLLANSSVTKQKQFTEVGGSLLLNMLSQELVENMMAPSQNLDKAQQKVGKASLFQRSWSINETTEKAIEEQRRNVQEVEVHQHSDVQHDEHQHDEQQYQEHQHTEQLKPQRRRARKQKEDRRQREDLYRQKPKTDEPLIILGEFGQRLPNYTRPSLVRESNQPRQLEVFSAPSIYLQPPVVTNFRHFNLQQPMLTITANSMRRRKRPKTSTSSSPFDSDAVIPDVPQVATTNPLKTSASDDNRVQISEEINLSPKVFAPRPFSSIPFSVINPSSLSIASEPSHTISDHQDLISERHAISPSPRTSAESNPTASRLTQEKNTFRATVRITPPSKTLTPPILGIYNSSKFSQNNDEDTQVSTPSQRNYVQSPQYANQAELRSTLFQSPENEEIASHNTTILPLSNAVEHQNENHYNEHLWNQVEERQEKPNYMAIIVDVNFVNKTSRRKSSRHRRPQHKLINRDYGELQLSAAETAYFKRRRPIVHPNTVSKHTEEIGSIPGTPGMDYPIFSKPPKTSFSCANKYGQRGYFADVNTGCQVFYICSEEGRGEPMLCPNGTLFNQDFLVCDWWFNVVCEGVS